MGAHFARYGVLLAPAGSRNVDAESLCGQQGQVYSQSSRRTASGIMSAHSITPCGHKGYSCPLLGGDVVTKVGLVAWSLEKST